MNPPEDLPLSRRIRLFFVRDWVEIFAFVFGLVCLAVLVACVVGVIVLVTSFGKDQPGFLYGGRGFLMGASVFGIAILATLGFLASIGGWLLAGRPIRRAARRRRSGEPERPFPG